MRSGAAVRSAEELLPASQSVETNIDATEKESGTSEVNAPPAWGGLDARLRSSRFFRAIKKVHRDKKPCGSLTRGLLRRSHIVANVHRYVGKETSRRWEQGDDMSMVDFRCKEYTDGKTVANKDLRKRIAEIGIRKMARESGVNREAVAMIAKRDAVKPNTLAKVVSVSSSPI